MLAGTQPQLKSSMQAANSVQFLKNYSGAYSYARDAIHRANGATNLSVSNKGKGNGETTMPVYYNEIPEGKSGFLSIYDSAWDGATFIDYNYGRVKMYGNIGDCIWFYVINPQAIRLSTTNITYFQWQNKQDIIDTMEAFPEIYGDTPYWYVTPWSHATLFLVVEDMIFADGYYG